MRSIQVDIEVVVPEQQNGIVISELAEIGYEGFWESDTGVSAFVDEARFDERTLRKILSGYTFVTSVNMKKLPNVNWNAVWESNYHPIPIEDQCLIRAPFHPEDPTFLYEVIIQPQMSFGTGHHNTTYLMVKNLLKENLKNKAVLDMGCGTGVLAILAEKTGAQLVWAIDIDEWAYKNTLSNILLNASERISVKFGGVEAIPGRKFDLILANINKNVLKKDVGKYVEHLTGDGVILMSGFFEIDIPELEDAIEARGLRIEHTETKGEWAMIKCKRR